MMRTILLSAMLLFSASVFAADYSGQWTLDKTQSKDLPPYYENVKSHVLDIRQDAKELVVKVTITTADRGAEHFDFRYLLDGTPVASETKMRTPNGEVTLPATLTAKPADDGGLSITIAREIPAGGETIKGMTYETWHVDATGKVLTIDRVDDSPRRHHEAKMIFTK
jgi:archaellum component FlaF (FlaF/FlaG flagellin family)